MLDIIDVRDEVTVRNKYGNLTRMTISLKYLADHYGEHNAKGINKARTRKLIKQLFDERLYFEEAVGEDAYWMVFDSLVYWAYRKSSRKESFLINNEAVDVLAEYMLKHHIATAKDFTSRLEIMANYVKSGFGPEFDREIGGVFTCMM